MKKHYPHIIETSRSLPVALLLRDIILTALCWLLYLYFLRPAFGFISDVFSWIGNGFTGAENYESFRIMDFLIFYIKVIVIMNAVYIAWALYNRIRFTGKNRRRNAPPVSTEEIGTRYKLNPRDVEGWQKAKTLVVHHDSEGRITNVVKV